MQLRIRVTIFSNGSIIPTGFKFMELHALTLAARSYVLLLYSCTMYAYNNTWKADNL